MINQLLTLVLIILWMGCGNNHQYYEDRDKLYPRENHYPDGTLKDEFQVYAFRIWFVFPIESPHGLWKHYDKNGNLYWEVPFASGSENGKWVWYDEVGNVTDEDIFKDGVCVAMCEDDGRSRIERE